MLRIRRGKDFEGVADWFFLLFIILIAALLRFVFLGNSLLLVFLSTLIVVLGYKIVVGLFNQKLALLFALVLATTPHFVFLFRPDSFGLEHIFFFLSILSFAIFLRSGRRLGKLVLGTGVVLALFYLLFPLLPVLSDFHKIYFLKDPGVTNSINASRGEEIKYGIPVLARPFFNKGYFIIYWFSQYLKQYALSNVFSLIEVSTPSSNFPGTPSLLVFAPFFAYGLISSFRLLQYKRAGWLFFFLLLTGVPASLLAPPLFQEAFSFSLLIISFYVSLGILRFVVNRRRLSLFLLFLALNLAVTYSYYFGNF